MTIKAMSRNELIDVKLVRGIRGDMTKMEKGRVEDNQLKQSISNCPYNLLTLIYD